MLRIQFRVLAMPEKHLTTEQTPQISVYIFKVLRQGLTMLLRLTLNSVYSPGAF